jgi:ribonuclease BN (tRNA processing enzyme)
VTHLHWDHVQGLPFFRPILHPKARLDVYGPPQRSGSLDDAFRHFIRPPYFPVTVEELYGQMAFHDAGDVDLEINGAKVRVRPVPHVGENNGYRVEMGGVSVAYVSDHQMPRDGRHAVTDSVLELCDGVDLLIHDAQFTAAEFAEKPHWGHCTVAYAVFVAKEAGAKRLALFHHDPGRCDDDLDALLAEARDLAAASSVSEVLAAYEGLTLSFGG